MTSLRTPAGGIMTREQHEKAVAFARKANSWQGWLKLLLPAVEVDASGKEIA